MIWLSLYQKPYTLNTYGLIWSGAGKYQYMYQ